MLKLFRHPVGDGLSLGEALAQAPTDHNEAIALVYEPRRCVMARLDQGRLLDESGREIGRAAFEARVFNDRWELRWVQTGMEGARRLGRAALITETRPAMFEGNPDEAEELPEIQYILWGQGDDPAGLPAGWSQLSTARIGPLRVPYEGLPTKGLLALIAVEYVAQGPHGNAYILDERLTGLRLYEEKADV